MKFNGIDIIIPVHKYNEEISRLLERCLQSIKDMAISSSKNNIKIDVQIVGPSDLPYDEIIGKIEWTNEFNSFNVSENVTGNFDFSSQINFAVENLCKNDYFMIVEFDDIVTPKWLNNASCYIEKRQKCPAFLPLTEVYDIKNPKTPLYYINEIGWSSSFVDNELGVINNESLHDYCNFNITGGIFKKKEFLKSGGLKPSIKLSFGYELLLRLTHLYNDIFIIPKVGYFHFVNRDDSLTSEYHQTMTQEEGSWWIDLAVKEYEYKDDRNKTYTPNEEE